MNPHLHDYKIECIITNGHVHKIIGYTESIIGFNMFHFHHFSGICSYNGHTHYYSGFTGLPIITENGHVHRIESILETTSHHEHLFNGFTSEEIQYISRKIFKSAII